MSIEVTFEDLAPVGEVLALGVFATEGTQDGEGPELVWGPGAEMLDDDLLGRLAARARHGGFQGKLGQTAHVLVPDGPFGSVLLVGLGEEVDTEGLRQAAGWAAKALSAEEVSTTLQLVDVDGATEAVVEGFGLGAYRFDRYKPSDTTSIRRLRLLGGGDEDQALRARHVVAGVELARDLVNEPSNRKSPEEMADVARRLADETGLRIEVLDEEACAREGLEGILAVGMGSTRPPRLVRLEHGDDDAPIHLVLAGKGIVFDSGGLSLKSAQNMENMKTDMAGAATVLGAMKAIAGLGLPVRVTAFCPFAENMPSGSAARPGDVIHPRGGPTVEILNTDAEGRLVLADALGLASELEPDLIVDVATLTGAAKVALGPKIGALFANHHEAAALLRRAAEEAGERFWEMPLPDDYRTLIESDIAEIKNTGGRWGGAITAALFLASFVGDRRWAHLDIAGPARWPESEHYQPKGGSGFGVRTLVALAEALAPDA